MERIDGRQKKFIRELAEKARIRRESGLFVVDGPRMCAEIPAELVSDVYVTEAFLKSLHADTCEKLLRNAGFTAVTDAEMKQMSDTVTPQGILCVARQPKCIGVKGLLEAAEGKKPLLVLLETLQDPGNLGTIIRASEAAGVTGIIMNSTTVDVFSPKVVRSTMGSVFRVPFVTVSDLAKVAEDLSEGFYTGGERVEVLAACLQGSSDYTAFDYRRSCAFMIGNESAGLSPEIIEKATVKIRIPMEGSVESLNAAMAATVIAFEASRQRRM